MLAQCLFLLVILMNNKIKIFILLVLISSLSFSYYFLTSKQNKKSSDTLPNKFKIGIVNNCRKIPSFITKLNMRQPAIDSKQQGHGGGLLIRDISQPKNTWQGKSWKQSGYIGAFERDSIGNIFLTPVPYVSLKKNPPKEQNQIYIINAQTSEMSLFMKMPSTKVPNTKNPFGTMGLSYDCDTDSLYVTSVAGSEPLIEHGIIYQVDVINNKVTSKFEHTDAIGVGIFNTLKGKRLYYGSARNPHIYSILLDEFGKFSGKKRYEFSLTDIQGGNSTLARKIQFKKVGNKYQMIIKETEFGFRLMAENNLNLKKYIFQYSLSQDKWIFLNAVHE